ncbi:hypothetical protein PsorP6_014252 [Peronosclerospora sorghi]|uniref:Uncharacterized protein n=1 Tax=Peronosclerospora sorghi TaxID=230839 RepID=A0ACC0VKV2_9STRA|nr:hypothetical protein PsorP6_014252 [Peronosclerospora sorghi]
MASWYRWQLFPRQEVDHDLGDVCVSGTVASPCNLFLTLFLSTSQFYNDFSSPTPSPRVEALGSRTKLATFWTWVGRLPLALDAFLSVRTRRDRTSAHTSCLRPPHTVHLASRSFLLSLSRGSWRGGSNMDQSLPATSTVVDTKPGHAPTPASSPTRPATSTVVDTNPAHVPTPASCPTTATMGHRHRSVSMNVQSTAPPSKKQRASDDEYEQASPPRTAAVPTFVSPADVLPEKQDDDHASEQDSDGQEEEDAFLTWLVAQKTAGIPATQLLEVLGLGVADGVAMADDELWDAMLAMGMRLLQPSVTRPRAKLAAVNTLHDVAALLRTSRKIVVLAGAGISVSCGIPDFRSENGIYSRLGEYNLPNPQCMFDIDFFRSNPRPFFAFAKELFPKSRGYSFVPSQSHYFVKLLEQQGKLLRIYSQNIDMLEHAAGISPDRAVLCHGSFATATCLACKRVYPNAAIRDQVLSQRVPMCTACRRAEGIIKPDIVFFGESLPRRFHDSIKRDESDADLVLVMGSSLKVNPVRSIVGRFKKNTPMILINREPVGRPHAFDVELLGYSDEIVLELCRLLDWELPQPDPALFGHLSLPSPAASTPRAYDFVPPSRHLFHGAKSTYASSSDDDESSDEGLESDASRETMTTALDDDDEKPGRKQDVATDEHEELLGSGTELLRPSVDN